MQVKFKARWLREESGMVQETTRDEMFREGKIKSILFNKVNGC